MSTTKRWRTPRARRGELKAVYGSCGDHTGIVYVPGGDGATNPDGHLLYHFFGGMKLDNGRGLVEELEHRGYDITTLKFSIRRKVEPKP